MKKQPRQKLLSRDQVEKQFQDAVKRVRTVRGFVNLDFKAAFKISDGTAEKDGIVLQSKHAL